MNRLIKSVLIAAAAVLTTVSASAEPDQATQAIFKNLMAATVSNNYDGFMAESDATLKGNLKKSMLERVSKELEPRARQGYDTQYLGELKIRGNKVRLGLTHKAGWQTIQILARYKKYISKQSSPSRVRSDSARHLVLQHTFFLSAL